jgi:hypothetical protein
MTGSSLVMMLIAWTAVTGLAVWCLARVMKG